MTHLSRYEEKNDMLSKITYTTTMVDVHKAVGDWTSTQGRHAHKIRGKGNTGCLATTRFGNWLMGSNLI